jgi:predicted metal-dependent hydrolase
MTSETILIGERELVFKLRRSGRRTIGFAIDHDGLTVSAPLRLARREIDRAILGKSGWILGKLAKWADRPASRKFDFETGARLPWLGGAIPLTMIDGKIRTQVTGDAQGVCVKTDPTISGALKRRAVEAGLIRYYKREGLKLMGPKVETYAERLERSVRKVLICDQKRRWGSCASDSTIRLNWRLMGFPEELIDYVCAHEAAHLVEPNHSAAYWRVVEGLVPDWKARRKRMRDEAEQWLAF